jgi:hypothetical protein
MQIPDFNQNSSGIAIIARAFPPPGSREQANRDLSHRVLEMICFRINETAGNSSGLFFVPLGAALTIRS